MSYFNLFIQKGMFHSHTCIQIITIDGRTFDLEKKSNKIIASHDRTLRSCEAAASIVHVINTPADMQLWKHLFFYSTLRPVLSLSTRTLGAVF